MPKVTWTKEQQSAIYEKGSNILVAAAAGSGKTAVLVERIINKIVNENVDIDKLLVVTFTNAAASEMRERILDAIYKKIEEYPQDVRLQKQINLLNKASICTIHSFCLEVIRNYFYELDLSANFRIADSAEIELLKQDVIEELFEEKYYQNDKNFITLINTYTTYRGDEPLKELVLKIYDYIQSAPFPKEWLNEKIEMFNLKEKLKQKFDYAQTIWGEILLEEYKDKIVENRLKLEGIKDKLTRFPELEKFTSAIVNDIEALKEIEEVISKTKENIWDTIYIKANELKFGKWPIDKKCTIDLKNEAKEVRDKVKKDIEGVHKKIFIYDSENAAKDIYAMYDSLKRIENIVNEFEEKFSQKKKEKNIIDFHDIEHFALKILVKQNENEEYVPSEVAKKIMEKYTEIAIDEYQDSNLVQEYILKVVSKQNNTFMVGDVKQSIYKFRQARPELFLEKYEKYKLVEENTKIERDELIEKNTRSETSELLEGNTQIENNIKYEPTVEAIINSPSFEETPQEANNEGEKIKLFKNFRSRENILKITNLIFDQIMSKKLGDIDYTKEEYLNLGANYENPPEGSNFAGKAELHIIDMAKRRRLRIYCRGDY